MIYQNIILLAQYTWTDERGQYHATRGPQAQSARRTESSFNKILKMRAFGVVSVSVAVFLFYFTDIGSARNQKGPKVTEKVMCPIHSNFPIPTQFAQIYL